MRPVLLVPGIGNSGPTHWQSLWEARYSNVLRLQQQDWEHPVCDAWAEVLELAVRQCAEPPIVVAHSLGCLVVARWAAHSAQAIHAALLVAVPGLHRGARRRLGRGAYLPGSAGPPQCQQRSGRLARGLGTGAKRMASAHADIGIQ